MYHQMPQITVIANFPLGLNIATKINRQNERRLPVRSL